VNKSREKVLGKSIIFSLGLLIFYQSFPVQSALSPDLAGFFPMFTEFCRLSHVFSVYYSYLNQNGGFPLKKLTSMVSRFCYDHPNFGIPNLMLFIVAGNAIVFVLDLLSSGTFSPMLEFIPAYLFQGQIWRLITFIFVPDNTNVLFLAISLWFYYWIGSNLERVWGTTRFSLF
jgi:hypothetical protein